MIIFDTETTGLKKAASVPLERQPSVIEFAAIKLDDATLEEKARIEFMCNPNREIEDGAYRAHKISSQDLIGKEEFSAHYPNLVRFFFGEKYLIAHNIAFDMSMLIFELKRIGKLTKFPYPPIQICTIQKTKHLNNGGWMKLQFLHETLLGKSFEEAHRAMKDVEALTRCVKELVKRGDIKIKS